MLGQPLCQQLGSPVDLGTVLVEDQRQGGDGGMATGMFKAELSG
jgi:hypothetical protein